MLSAENKMGKIKIFISHAHDDVALASELLNLIRGCIKIYASEIRCTSVPGYALPLGHISGQIKEELSGCDIVIGLITRNGIESDYVNFELGVGWYLNKAWALLNDEVDYADIPGPLKEHYALKLNNAGDLMTLITEISTKANLHTENLNIINEKVQEFSETYKTKFCGPFRKILKIDLVSGENNTYENAVKLIKLSKRIIRATNFGNICQPPPEYYTDAINSRLKESITSNTPIEFRIVASSKVGLDKRFDNMEEEIRKLWRPKIIDIKHVLLGVLIVDDTFALIAFPELPVDTHFRTCLSINDPECVRLLIDWYDNFLWNYKALPDEG